MFRLACRDLGAVDCDHVIEAETIEEAKQMLVEHAEKTHGDLIENLSENELIELNEKIDQLLSVQQNKEL